MKKSLLMLSALVLMTLPLAAMEMKAMDSAKPASPSAQAAPAKVKVLKAKKAPKKAKAPKALYRCPMHHEVTSDKPGVCPKCHMDLEKVSK